MAERDGAPETTGACRHCGLPVPSSARFPGFCCPGCHQVYQLLHDSALGDFYELGGGRGRPLGIAPQPGRHPWLAELERESAQGDLVRLRLDVQGIYCAACIWVLQELWRRRDGAVSIRIDPSLGRAELVYDPRRLDLAGYLAEVERLGYRMGPATKSTRSPTRPLLLRFGICVALSLNAMMFAAAIYFGLAEGRLYDLFRTLSFVIATIAVLVGGPVFFRAAWAGLRSRVLHLDQPIALGILLAWGGSLAGMLSTGEHSYFDTVTVFVTLMLGGRFVQEQALRRNRDYLLQNDGAEHLRATRLRGSEVETVPVRDVGRGDALLVAPGDLVPVRGVLCGEAASFSLEWIRGESDPRRFEPGEQVPAGAVHVGERPSRIDSLEDLESSGLLELLRGIDDEPRQASLPPFWSLLNRVYVAAVLGLAALAAGLWWILDPTRILPVTVSVLVVTCPCALGIAIPLAFDLALARLRRHGIFVRTLDLCEKARTWRRVFFDKTGTLTWGGLRARCDVAPAAASLDLLYTMTASSRHPVSRAIHVDLGGGHYLPGLRVDERIGKGLEVRDGGRVWRLGRPDWAMAAAVPATDRGGVVTGGGPEGGEGRRTVLTVDGGIEGSWLLEEDYRPGFEDELRALEAEGLEVHLVSGDRSDKVEAAARRLGLEPGRVRGDLGPEDKAAYLREHGAADALMVGDGLNDAPAFRVAGSTATPALDRPVLPSQADFYYVGSGADAVRRVRETAARLRRVVRRDLWIAGLYNLGALALCFAGLMTPLLCAVLMPASSLLLLAATFAGFRRSASAGVP